MSIIFIAEIIKSLVIGLSTRLSSVRGSVMNACVSAILLLMPKTLPVVTPLESLSWRAWRMDNASYILMRDIIAAAELPYEKIQGFKLKHGRWYICLVNIGWLRTSDVLQMQIKLYPPQEIE